jgi:hypothetical protein
LHTSTNAQHIARPSVTVMLKVSSPGFHAMGFEWDSF